MAVSDIQGKQETMDSMEKSFMRLLWNIIITHKITSIHIYDFFSKFSMLLSFEYQNNSCVKSTHTMDYH